MAGKGGGAWKVAYADFVTAMMAFFLVMWICAQDQKLKESVAHYFMNPLGGTPIGASKTPGKSGAMFENSNPGQVPMAESIAMGRGRNSYTGRGEPGVATRLVSDWIENDETVRKHWRERARGARDRAGQSAEVREKGASVDEVATKLLAEQLKEEISRSVSGPASGVHKDLLSAALTEVNWAEIAEDVLTHVE